MSSAIIIAIFLLFFVVLMTLKGEPFKSRAQISPTYPYYMTESATIYS